MRRRVVASVLAAFVGLLGLGSFLPHTDDGCAVEVHCLACRAHLNNIGNVVVASSIFAFVDQIASAWRNEVDVYHSAPGRLRPPGRAPPLTA